jgi:glyoxylase-like metal-dependent hydrolase (beta-lactamase superfamily II)
MQVPLDSFTVGDARVHRIEEIRTRLPFAMFNAGTELMTRHAHWLVPDWVDRDNTWEMVVQSWILIVDGQVVVVDPCVGNGRRLPEFPIFDMLDTPFIERFAASGIRPEHVDAVFCTHLHSDHCGWNTLLRDGRFVPTFPKARYYMAQREFDRWDPRRPDHRPVPANEGVFERSVLPVVEAGQAQIIPDNYRISASLEVTAAAGHTLGHTALHLSSAGREAWFTGDVFHHPIELLHPELDAHTCEDFSLTLVTRNKLIAACIDRDAMIIPAHFAAPHVGYLREQNGVRTFHALKSDAVV